MDKARLTRRAFIVGLAGAAWAISRRRPASLGQQSPQIPPSPTATPSAAPSPAPSPAGSALTGFDTVVLGGRVMDPETQFDGIANVGIKNGVVTAISDRPMTGRETIDATGLVVSPGFIDNLTYEPNEFGVWYKIADGVTANIGMHGFDGSASAFFADAGRRRWPLHYGGAFDDPWWRAKIGVGAFKKPSPSQVRELASIAEQQIRDGWIGADFEPEYSPGTSYEEIVAITRLMKRYDMPAYFHVRYSDDQAPGTEANAVDEVIRAGRETGAPVHIQHINSTGGTFTMSNSLKMMQRARDEGIDVTACIYPYNFWSTFLASARFGPGWQERFHITYSDLEVPGTGERLTDSSFKRYQQQNKVVIAYAIPEQSVVTALKSPLVMMGSDTILVPGAGRHPRGAGAFSRVLGKYVREQNVLPLMDALAKMTIMPARKIESGAPAMQRKGRLQEGMDADITIFDPRKVIDRATVRKPAQYSSGIEWVLVMGHVVKDRRGLNKNVRFGTPILSSAALGQKRPA